MSITPWHQKRNNREDKNKKDVLFRYARFPYLRWVERSSDNGVFLASSKSKESIMTGEGIDRREFILKAAVGLMTAGLGVSPVRSAFFA